MSEWKKVKLGELYEVHNGYPRDDSSLEQVSHFLHFPMFSTIGSYQTS